MYGLIINSAMDASKIHNRTRLNASDSLTSGHLPQLCWDIFSKTIKSFVGIHRRVKFAVNLQILAKFDVLQGQNAVKDCNIEPMSALSNGCINFDEAMLSCGIQQQERALNTSPNEIYKTGPELSLNSSKLCRSELVDVICSSLNSTVRRIAFLDQWQSFSEPRISYSDLLRMFSQNLSKAFNHNQNHLTCHCFHQSEDNILAAKLGNRCDSTCTVNADEAVGISANSSNTFSSRFSQDCSERNTDRLMHSETTKIHASLACSVMKAECTKTESLATDSIYSNSSCCHLHMTAAADKSGNVAVTQNSSYLDMNLSAFDPSHLSINGAMIAMTKDDDGDDDLADDMYCSVTVVDNKETDEKVTDEENRDEEETDEDVLADDESSSANIRGEEITDEETDEEEGEIERNGKATALACSRSNKANTSTGVKTFCKSSFFISPSEMDSSDSSSDSDAEDDEDDDLEVDGWDSSEDQSADTLFSGICESFSFNGLYFPSSCSAVEAKLSLEELKENDRTRLLSTSGSPSASPLDCSWFDNSCDDIVFCDDQESLSCASEDEEDLPLTNLSHVQSINARWNHFYSAPREVEKPTQKKKQVRFARDSSLVTTYAEAMSEAEDYAAARKGPWEEYARDRDRFARRIRDTTEQISWVLSPSHRREVYKNSFSKS